MIAILAGLALSACGEADGPEVSPLDHLDLVGVDFELNSMIIENTGTSQIRTEGLWAYRDGEQFEFNIFIIEPRATILFSMGELGEISTGGGEIALADSGSFDVPDSLLEYVAWGEGDFPLSSTATAAGLWPPDEGAVSVPAESVILIRVDPTNTGPIAWEASDQID
jgi:hypothetical protein